VVFINLALFQLQMLSTHILIISVLGCNDFDNLFSLSPGELQNVILRDGHKKRFIILRSFFARLASKIAKTADIIQKNILQKVILGTKTCRIL